jgi:cathepsin L
MMHAPLSGLLVLAAGPLMADFAGAVMVETSDLASGDFGKYMSEFERDYAAGSEEYTMREQIFQRRWEMIQSHNSNPNRLWNAGLNHLSDYTGDEYQMLLGWRGVHRGEGGGVAAFMELSSSEEKSYKLAEEVDWRNLEMAKKVPNQGGCGSCWALATTTMLDAHSEIHTEEKRTFSPAQLVDCVPNPRECGGQGGCQGATVELGMAYIEKMGLEDASVFPYTKRQGECQRPLPADQAATFLEVAHADSMKPHRHKHHRHNKHNNDNDDGYSSRSNSGSLIGLQSWVTLQSNRARPLMSAVMDGPVAISVAANAWHSYEDGIFDGCDKDAVINHAVVMFGYGQESGKKYWAIRNSWGKKWGEDGFIRLLRQDSAEEEDAYCGIDHDPAKGIECKPYPDQVKVCGMCGILYDSVAVKFHNMSKVM